MFSNLASALIKLPKKSSDISDLFWKFSNIRNLERPLAVPSNALIKEYFALGDKEVLNALALKIPSPEGLNYLISLGVSKSTIECAQQNPFADQTLYKGNITNSNEISQTPLYTSYQMSGESKSIDEILKLDDYHIQDWFKMLLIVDENSADLLLLNFIESRRQLDAVMLMRVISADNELTVVAKNKVLEDIERYPLTPAANRLMVIAGLMVEQSKRREDKSALDMISSYKLAGISDFELLPLILANDNINVNSDELVKMLADSSPSNIALFLLGGNSRKPRVTQPLTLLKKLSSEKAGEVAKILTESMESSPWADEIVLGLPAQNYDKLGYGSLTILDRYISQRVNTASSMEILLAMSQEWESSLDDLLKAAVLV
ncbi:MAG: hypothetical protein ACKOW9_04860 [Candidatus Paceibacterota bacterium]